MGRSNAWFMPMIEQLLRPSSFQRRFFFLAKRFVAGETIGSALDTVRELNAEGLTATLDFLGEDVAERAEAERTRDIYLDMLAEIERSRLRTNVSVKLTALGLLIDEDLCLKHLDAIAARAADRAWRHRGDLPPMAEFSMLAAAPATATRTRAKRHHGPSALQNRYAHRRCRHDRARRRIARSQGFGAHRGDRRDR